MTSKYTVILLFPLRFERLSYISMVEANSREEASDLAKDEMIDEVGKHRLKKEECHCLYVLEGWAKTIYVGQRA